MPFFEHRGHRPRIDPTAWIAPTAVICGDVEIGAGARVLFGAVITAEDGRVRIGRNCVVMENAVIRGRRTHPVEVGDDVMVGPHAHLNGATVGAECFVATGVSVFPGARLGARSEIRIRAVVQVNTVVPPDAVVPIGWVAVGDPAQILPPDRHDEIWEVQRTLDFPGTVYGVARGTSAAQVMARQSDWFGAHAQDQAIDPSSDGPSSDGPGPDGPSPDR